MEVEHCSSCWKLLQTLVTFNSVLYIAKKRHLHSDNWCYLKTSVVLFFKLVISLLQTKCSYTILYCTVGCCLASKSSCDLVWSCVEMVFFGCWCFREHTGQIGLTFWEAKFKVRKFNTHHNDFELCLQFSCLFWSELHSASKSNVLVVAKSIHTLCLVLSEQICSPWLLIWYSS